MTRFAVVGSPISHSLSPTLHRAAYETLELDWVYDAFEVEAQDFEDFVASLSGDFRGLSVTMPDKKKAFQIAQQRDRISSLTQSSNTLFFSYSQSQRHIAAFNTDVFGITQTFKDFGATSAQSCVIFGTGSTASSALVAASELNVQNVTVVARNRESFQVLNDLADFLSVQCRFIHLTDIKEVPNSEIAICTLPSDVELDLSYLSVNPHSLFLDVSYNPWPTKRAEIWKELGGKPITGLHMLVRQALRQVRIFVSGNPEIELSNENEVFEKMCQSVNLATGDEDI